VKWRPRNRRLTKTEVYVRAGSHTVTWWLGRRCPGVFPFVFLPGYPKSGTTWAAQLVGDYLELPFVQGSLTPVGCQAVVQGHQIFTRDLRYAVYSMRDGRDVMTSLYFFLARRLPEGDYPKLTRRQRRMFPGLVNRDDVRANLPAFIREQMRRPFGSPVNWPDHVGSYLTAASGAPVLRYEDLLSEDATRVLAEACGQVTGQDPDPERAAQTIDKFSFRRQAGRKSGSEQRASFLRKGQAGDWVNHFTREAAEVFDELAGDVLIAAGYEPDRSWVEGVAGEAPPEANLR
jgi:hypothetical protein